MWTTFPIFTVSNCLKICNFQAAAAAGNNSAGGGTKNSGSSLSVSPAPPTGQQQRIPSPQELVYHAQQIMQNALIKRKLEEQKENYR